MGRKNFRIVSIQPGDFAEWDEFVKTSQSGSVYHLSSYIRILAHVTGGRFRIVAVRLRGTIVAGATLFEMPLALGCYSSSRTLLYYHGLVLGAAALKKNNAEARSDAIEPLEKFIRAMGYASVSMNHRHPICDLRVFSRAGWKLQVGYTYEVQLSDMGALWHRIDQNQRRLIRRAQKNGYTVSEDSDFDSFFGQHMEVHKRKGASLYLNRRRYENYFRLLREKGLCRLYHARTERGESAASQLVLLGGHPVAHTISAGGYRQFLKDGAASFLRWKVYESLSKDGYLANDLTDASVYSVARFKRDMGGELKMCIRATKQFHKTWFVNQFASRAINKIKKRLRINKK